MWTGAHMMIWRGPETGRAPDGSAYDSATRAWRAASPAPIESRSHPAAIWNGHEVLVWGGLSATGIPFADGAAYDPAAWTGRAFAAWDDARRAATFDPRSDRWSPVGGLASHDAR